MAGIVGREKEIELLERYMVSDQAEFIAIYGRRRVGKTYLINQLLGDRFAFSMTGIIGGTPSEEMEAFTDSLSFAGYDLKCKPDTWLKAFSELRKFLQPIVETGKPCIVFLDEIPSLDTQRSGFVRALGYFWNSWASLHDNFKLIVCGSATTWMIKNIIDDKGGLHNRLTHEMPLSQFSLAETEKFLQSKGFIWNRLSILQCYMALGGVAYYLSLLDSKESLAQNIDRLFFRQNAEMKREYSRLFKTLFNSTEPYMKIVQLLSKKKAGLTRTEISEELGYKGSTLTEYLENLKNCEFIRYYYASSSRPKINSGYYQLIDFFTLFYLNFIPKAINEEDYWCNHLNTPEVNTWYGLAFERICLTHVQKIKASLHLDRISTKTFAWRSRGEDMDGAQVDLIIDRADNMTNLCEVKYCKDQYVIEKYEYEKIRHRITAYQAETKTKNGIYPTLITTYGLAPGKYNNIAMVQLCLDDLF